MNSWVTQGRDSRRRRDAARERFLREVRELPISVPCVPMADLAPAAIDCRNRFQEHRDGVARPISLKTGKATVNRLIVNYLKHQVTSYEGVVEQSGDYRIDDEAYRILRTRVLDKIADTYPELAEECRRQRERTNFSEILEISELSTRMAQKLHL